ncbi:ALBINO3-like protein 2, chloroplastic isoform X2 [Typha angustifolia]|uniref:ALBINO3-like protein 2, chloroplastic isoform X2 n=1 Tax=Typha angustifolia TaxID=59011 RepID=UPI003C2FC3E9
MGFATQLRHLRGRRFLLPPAFSTLSHLSSPLRNPSPPPSSLLLPLPLSPNPHPFSNGISSRSFSWYSWSKKSDNGEGASAVGDSPTGDLESELEFSSSLGSEAGVELSTLGTDELGLAEEAVTESMWDYLPRAVISLLDGYHDLTGFPWWVIISTSTLALRVSLLPVLILQLKKAGRIAELLPKLPPPLPPFLSGSSFQRHYLFFREKRRELGCPSFLWNFAFLTVQVPFFLLWMTSIRRMCLDNHSGFDTGGTLWFENLTDFPNGILGSFFPILIAGLHYVNVQVSFQTVQLENLRGILGFLTKYYKLYLDILAIPLLLIGFHIPQGSLVYWVTNSSFTLFQQLALRNAHVRAKLELPDMKVRGKKMISQEDILPRSHNTVENEISAETLSAENLLDLAIEDMKTGEEVRALSLLGLAIEKDPDLVRALVAMGQILCSKQNYVEAAEYFERAILQFQEDDPLLVFACFGAGVSHVLQGDVQEGVKHLKRIAEMKEPESPMNKACYYQGLVLLGSTLFQQGEKSEAVKYLRIAATYDPGVNAYIRECEEELKN